MLKENTVIDASTGEVLEKTISVSKKVPTNKFIQIYIDDMKGLLKLDSGIQSNVLALIWQACEYSTDEERWNKIAILKDTKEK